MTIAFQGKKRIEGKDQLKAIISKRAKSENFGLLLGSGASRNLGGSVMNEVWDNFNEKYLDSFEFLFREGILSPEDEKLNKNRIVGLSLDRLTEIVESPESNDGEMIGMANTALMDLVRALVSAALLDENFWGQTQEALAESTKLCHHREVLRKICGYRQFGQPDPVIFTTNYDLSIEWAARSLDIKIQNGFTGIGQKSFSPKVFARILDKLDTSNENSNSINLIKLHGSLNWKQMGERIEELPESEALAELSDFIEFKGKSDIPKLMILPGGSMYVKTTEYPHKVFLDQFDSFLHRPDPVLFVVGYGHCDSHIDQNLYSALTRNDSLNLVIYYPELTSLEDTASLADSINRIIELDSSNVTIIGGGANAHFSAFCRNLHEIQPY